MKRSKKKNKRVTKISQILIWTCQEARYKEGPEQKKVIMALYIYTWKNHSTASQKFYLLIQMKPDSSVKTQRWINTPRSIPKSITESSQNCSSAESFLCPHTCKASCLMDHASFNIDCLPAPLQGTPSLSLKRTIGTPQSQHPAAAKRRRPSFYCVCALHHKLQMKLQAAWKEFANVKVIETSKSKLNKWIKIIQGKPWQKRWWCLVMGWIQWSLWSFPT